MKQVFIIAIIAVIIFGCAREAKNPVSPSANVDGSATLLSHQINQSVSKGPYHLWSEGFFYFSADHDRVDIVPRREGRFHLNALKFLEQTCKNCLSITGLKNNGDGTIDLRVKITHPFIGHPEYTGFDVKGIIMFNGSRELINNWPDTWPDIPEVMRTSWRELGDPEVINPDGYVLRWNPEYESGSDLPIFNYFEGKYSSGVPNAHINAYLNFYNIEERHIFTCFGSVERVYTIWLPPGVPVVAGYAVEACWEPPINTPVTNPIADFPISANQPEAYHFKFVVNNGDVITDCYTCCGQEADGTDLRAEIKFWHDITWKDTYIRLIFNPGLGTSGNCFWCKPPEEEIYCPSPWGCHNDGIGNGKFRQLAISYRHDLSIKPHHFNLAFDLYDYTVDE
ncbi:MAG: hypothetical protein ABIC40_08430 [bacterium]